MPAGGLRFDRPVPSGGYSWWYIDALSDDGLHGITLIAFVGSVFSPYYAWSRRRGAADPLDHCALNVALYSPRAGRWSMTERGAHQVSREASRLTLHRSHLEWNGADLMIAVDEVCAPLPYRLRGSIRVTPTTLTDRAFALDPAALHTWTPFAPCAQVEVRFTEPGLHWSGTGYLDSNFGGEPLENGFCSWTWSRASLPDGAVVLYDVNPRASAPHSLALKFTPQGEVANLEVPPPLDLPRTGWRLARQTRAEPWAPGDAVRVIKTLEDAPFYSRSLLATRLQGRTAPAIHESLDLDRFRAAWVQTLLPFRMPRRMF